MAKFTNQATLSYNGVVTNSNIITGEVQELLAVAKNAVVNTYLQGSVVTYAISLVNSGTAPFTGVTVTDNLGQYSFGLLTPVPLDYVAGSAQLFINGTLQDTPDVTAGPPLVFRDIDIAAGANAVLLYSATVNEFAPLSVGSTIVNVATVDDAGISTPLTATTTITADAAASLSISKSLSPAVVNENGRLTYTFTIQNFGNSATVAIEGNSTILTDTFDPILNPISVTFNGTPWALTTNYTYNTESGDFATLPAQITVPAATYMQDPLTGIVSVMPGVSTLIVTGTV